MKTKALQFILPLFIAIFLVPQVTLGFFETNLKYGDRGEKVAELQEYLISNGFMAGSATGNFYSITKKAVKDFQIAHNLPSTGYFGVLSRGVVNSLLIVDVPIESADLFSSVEVKPKIEVQNDQLNAKIQELEAKIIQLQANQPISQPMPEPVDLSELIVKKGNIRKEADFSREVYPNASEYIYNISFDVGIKDIKGRFIEQPNIELSIDHSYDFHDKVKQKGFSTDGVPVDQKGYRGASFIGTLDRDGTYTFTFTSNGKTKTETIIVP